MKKLFNKFLLFGAVGGLLIMTSCGDDSEEEPTPGPTITVALTSGQTISSDTIRASSGGELTFDVDITAPAGFNVLRITDQSDDEILQEVNRNDLGIDVSVSVIPTISTATLELPVTESTAYASLEFTAVDENSATASEVMIVEIEGEPQINSYTAVLLGGQLNGSTGSFYNTQDDMVYSIGQAATNDDMVDLVFYYVNNTDLFNIIAAPDNAAVQTTFETDPDGAGPLEAPGWPLATEQSTRFKPLDASFDFDGATTASDLENAYPEVGDNQDRMLNLQVDQVFAIQLADARGARYGIIKVTSIDGSVGSERSITLDVKVQSEDN